MAILGHFLDVTTAINMSATGGAVGTTDSSEVTGPTIHYIEKDIKSDSNDPSIKEEQGEVVGLVNHDQDNTLVFSHEDPFPIDPNEELKTQQFTARVVFGDSCLGGVIAASKSVISCLSGELLLTWLKCLSRSEDWLHVWRKFI